jgi:hypothetical protein
VAQLAALVQFLFILAYGQGFVAVVAISMALARFALESFPFFNAFLTSDGGMLYFHVSYFDI